MHEDIQVGDTVYTSESGYWYLLNKPKASPPLKVVKKSAKGRIAVDHKHYGDGQYTDRVYFKTPQEVLDHYRQLALAEIERLQQAIEYLRDFIEKCREK